LNKSRVRIAEVIDVAWCSDYVIISHFFSCTERKKGHLLKEMMGEITVKPVATSLSRFSVVEVDHARQTDCFRSLTDSRIWMVIAYFRDLEAAREIRGHNLAASLVEDWLLDARIGRTQSFPVSKGRI